MEKSQKKIIRKYSITMGVEAPFTNIFVWKGASSIIPFYHYFCMERGLLVEAPFTIILVLRGVYYSCSNIFVHICSLLNTNNQPHPILI